MRSEDEEEEEAYESCSESEFQVVYYHKHHGEAEKPQWDSEEKEFQKLLLICDFSLLWTFLFCEHFGVHQELVNYRTSSDSSCKRTLLARGGLLMTNPFPDK
ncbi:hypothetical protein V8G54_008784 [Vigna mungo]|uniref:Uncharacterized protein n=1 Tax=Vigna mungo TaxID=3915 RepID=A0AAQ3P673_VIGMU